MIILGIDPGLATTGWGVIKKEQQAISMLGYGVVQTKPGLNRGKRFKEIYLGLAKIISKYKPEVVAVEKLFFFKNLKTALPVSEARGVVLLLVEQKKKKIVELTPLEVKMGICGYGRADKKQIQKMVQKILYLKELPKPDDASDALAAAICCGFLKCAKTFPQQRS